MRETQGKINMKKTKSILSFLLSILLIISVGCTDNQAVIYDDYLESNSETTAEINKFQSGNEALSGELTIYTTYFNRQSVFPTLIEEFNKVHPNVKITLVGPEEETLSSEYVLQTTVELMSGKTADIIDLKHLPYYKYAKSGLFEDLYLYMEKDSNFNEEDYYMNIFDATKYESGLYAVPSAFLYPLCRLNKQIVKDLNIDISSYENISFNQIYEIYERGIEEGKASEDLLISKYYTNSFFDFFEYTQFIDEENNTASFNSTEFIAYLENVKNINWPKIADYNYVSSFNSIEMDDDNLMTYTVSWFTDSRFAKLFSKESEEVTRLIPIVSSNGYRLIQTADEGSLAIMSDSENKELAWEFIKFQIEEKDHSETVVGENYFKSGIPVNKKNARTLMEKAFGEGHTREIEEIEKWSSTLNTSNVMESNADLMFALNEICQEYYNDLITVEQCAKRVQERVEIYLKE